MREILIDLQYESIQESSLCYLGAPLQVYMSYDGNIDI